MEAGNLTLGGGPEQVAGVCSRDHEAVHKGTGNTLACGEAEATHLQRIPVPSPAHVALLPKRTVPAP
jgi:hypothetical protein